MPDPSVKLWLIQSNAARGYVGRGAPQWQSEYLDAQRPPAVLVLALNRNATISGLPCSLTPSLNLCIRYIC